MNDRIFSSQENALRRNNMNVEGEKEEEEEDDDDDVDEEDSFDN